jgi:CheY-like chemotaxis protein
VATILLVEDEEASRYVATRELQAAGHRVIAVEGSMLALDIAAVEKIDLLVTDVRLPPGQPHGLALGAMLRNRLPHLPVVYVTGFPELVDGEAHDFCRILPKPVAAGALVAAAKEMLGNP